MKSSLRFYRDQNHRPRVYADSEQSTLADYLENDLQDTGTIAEILAVLDSTAPEQEREISGNSYTIFLDRNQVTLECLYTDERGYTLPRHSFQRLLTAWSTFLVKDSLLAQLPVF